MKHDPRFVLAKIAWAVSAIPIAAYVFYGFARLGGALLRRVWRDMQGDEQFRAREAAAAERRARRLGQRDATGAGEGRGG